MLIRTAVELGLISSLTVLALFLSYSMLNVCDLATDGIFTIGACVGAVVAIQGHPFLSIIAALAAGMLAGLITALLQTKMGVDSLLAGIIVNTASFSINIAIMGNSSLLNMNKTVTVFTLLKEVLQGTFLHNGQILLASLFFVVLVWLLLNVFLKTRLGLAIRATGNNPVMVEASSIDPAFTTIVGLMLSSSITALSGCLLAQAQKAVNIDIGQGILTICLASLLIGRILTRNNSVMIRTAFAIVGAIVFRAIYTAALRLNMPAYMLKLVSAVIVLIAISMPYLKERYLLAKKKRQRRQHA